MGRRKLSTTSQSRRDPALSSSSTALEVAGGPENHHSGDGAATTSLGHAGRVTGEKARELKLQTDELVTIINPQLVQCNRCGAEIKLSKKSQFDTYHWYQHKDRCLKKPVDELPESCVRPSRPAQSWSVARKVQSKRREVQVTRPTTDTAPRNLFTSAVHPPLSTTMPKRLDFGRPATPTVSSIAGDSSTDGQESPPPASPFSTFSIPLASATYELSSQAFERVQRWTLRDVDGLSGYPTLGEPYDDATYDSPRPYLIAFKESQVRGTYE